MTRAMAFCGVPMGCRYSSRRISPGVTGGFMTNRGLGRPGFAVHRRYERLPRFGRLRPRDRRSGAKADGEPGDSRVRLDCHSVERLVAPMASGARWDLWAERPSWSSAFPGADGERERRRNDAVVPLRIRGSSETPARPRAGCAAGAQAPVPRREKATWDDYRQASQISPFFMASGGLALNFARSEAPGGP